MKAKEQQFLLEDEISSWFMAKRDKIMEDGKLAPSSKAFVSLAQGVGTHLLKLVTVRAEISQSILRANPSCADNLPPLHASIDVKLFPLAGILLDRLNVHGHPARRLVDHLTRPDGLSPRVCSAFAEIFGSETLEALSTALQSDARPITRLPAADFPIIFVPRPCGGDLQITPLAPADGHANFHRVTAPFFEDAQEDHALPRRGRWHTQLLSGKSQNIGYAMPSIRRRFRASMPRVMWYEDTALRVWLSGGPFPRWIDPGVRTAALRYADLLQRKQSASQMDILAALDAQADALILSARAFRSEMLAEAALRTDEGELRKAPSEVMMILNRRWKGDEQGRTRSALISEHFRERVRFLR